MTYRLRIVGAGLAPVESIPLFHYAVGGRALRLVVASSEGSSPKCEGYDICDTLDASLSTGVPVPVERLSWRASMWGVDVVLLEGLEPQTSVDPRALKETLRRPLGLRTLGLYEAQYSFYDFIVFDLLFANESLPSRSARNLEEALESRAWVEAVAHIPDARSLDLALEVAGLMTARRETPLHVIVRDPGGGAGIEDFYRRLSSMLDFVYIHAGPYSRLDTLCPSCSSPVVTRWDGLLESLAPTAPRCPSCGKAIPLRATRNSVVGVKGLEARRRRGVSVWFNAVEL
ncbi:MAG: hypothetical protein F7C07_04270 [Desulfurococcales archaeon]|nr:hypothetical protein [Desulfurococcales archaeon]